MCGNAMIAKADKGKTIVIIHTQDYTNKVYTFLTENNFCTIPQDPTKKYLAIILKTLQLIQKNPTPATLNMLLKLHKPVILIRLVFNNVGAPSYKTAKKN